MKVKDEHVALAKSVWAAHLAYRAAREAATAYGLDCKNPEHIMLIGKRFARTVLIKGEDRSTGGCK